MMTDNNVTEMDHI